MPKMKFLVVGIVIIGAVSYLMYSGISESMVYYYTVGEVYQRASELEGQGIRVSGYVQPGTIVRDPAGERVRFTVFQKGSERTLPVEYQGIIPDTFKDNAEVVVEGVYRPQEKVFKATVLLAKCPSKYEALGDQHPKQIPLNPKADAGHD